MAKKKENVLRSEVVRKSESYSDYMQDSEQSAEDFIAGVEWLASVLGIEIEEDA